MPVKPKIVTLDGGAALVDLDARRAARLERSGPKQVRFGGKEWLLKPELPMRCIENFTAGDILGAFRRILVVPEMADDFLAAGDLSQDDFKELMEAVYSLDLGNSSPPPAR
jgi:hypothetical protein